MKPVLDKAEVSIDFPDKAYMGSFGRHSGFEVRADGEEVLLKLAHSGGERREFAMHVHYFLLADILAGVAEDLAAAPPLDETHREPLHEAAKALAAALKRKARTPRKPKA
jgi:hypothetical protein